MLHFTHRVIASHGRHLHVCGRPAFWMDPSARILSLFASPYSYIDSDFTLHRDERSPFLSHRRSGDDYCRDAFARVFVNFPSRVSYAWTRLVIHHSVPLIPRK